MSEEIVAEYVAADPTHKTSRGLVEEIATRHGLTVPKVRAVLKKANVYVAQPKLRDALTADEEALIRSRTDTQQPTVQERYEFFKALAEELGVRSSAITSHVYWQDYYPRREVEAAIHEQRKIDQIEAEQERERAARQLLNTQTQNARTEELREMARRNKLNLSQLPKAHAVRNSGGFSSILWIIIAVIGLGLMLAMCVTGDYGPASSDERYDALSQEGKDHFDKSMRDYDSFCAKNPSRC